MGTTNLAIPVAKKAALALFGHYRSIQSSLHELTYLFWECTLRCNLSCLHCGSDCQAHSNVLDMPLRDFLKILDQIKAVQNPNKITLALTGGEPLLRPDLEECGKEFNKRGYPWGMVTNGFAMSDDRYKKLVDSGLRSVTVSIDGLEESHNWLRCHHDSFRRALAAVKLIASGPQLASDVVTCVNQKNLLELGEIKKLLVESGVKNWRLFTIFPKGRAKDDRLLDISGNQFKDLMEFIKATRREDKIKASFSCEGYLGPYEGDVRDSFFFCRAGINVGSVLADGSISACPSLRGDYIQGNIYRDSFVDVWNNRFRIMRKRKWMKSGECGGCAAFKQCGGNGLHLREEKTGKLLRCHYHMLEKAVP